MLIKVLLVFLCYFLVLLIGTIGILYAWAWKNAGSYEWFLLMPMVGGLALVVSVILNKIINDKRR